MYPHLVSSPPSLQVLDNQMLLGRDLALIRDDVKGSVEAMKSRYEGLSEGYTSNRLELLQLEDKINNSNQLHRERFDHVKRAFKVRTSVSWGQGRGHGCSLKGVTH